MSEITAQQIQQHFLRATQLHQSGRLSEAKAAYEKVIGLAPGHSDALHYLGILMCQMGQPDLGAGFISKAVDLKPDVALYHNNLGTALKSCGKLEEALSAYRRSIEINPNDPIAHSNLGNILRDQGKPSEAIDACRIALLLNPEYAEAHNNLGNALKDLGLLEEAIAAYRFAANLQPNAADVQNNLGSALSSQGRLEEAVSKFNRSLEINPNNAVTLINLGIALGRQGRVEESIAAYRLAIEKQPDSAEALNLLGTDLNVRGLIDEAIVCFEKATQLMPLWSASYCNLGNALKAQGRIAEAIDSYRKAIELAPQSHHTYSNLLLAMQYIETDPTNVLRQSQDWNIRFAPSLASLMLRYPNDRNQHRRLKIGYVSPDFRSHSVARFILPILTSHDHQDFEIFCYSNVYVTDEVTDAMRRCADHWHDVTAFSDEQMANRIRQDRIDILVDLAGHTAGNRLGIFALKPAPIQVNYQGYPATTGLATIEYRLTDPIADPPGQTDSSCSETLIRLPTTAWCFQPPESVPAVGSLPATSNSYVTFGSFNDLAKLSHKTLKLWAEILHEVDGSRLIIKAKGLSSAAAKQRVLDIMSDARLDINRIDLIGWLSTRAHLALYGCLDIALDPFPYHGTTTTCESLWMGVPVVTLAGVSHVSRVGASLLTNVGLEYLIAETPREYIDVAKRLAGDMPRLTQLRQTLRERVQNSPLRDERQLAADIEAAYRSMWRTWCESGK